MRYLFSLFLTGILSFSGYAQHGWYVSSGFGANISDVWSDGFFSTAHPLLETDPATLIDFRVSKQINKHWQVGVQVETGNLNTWVKRFKVEYRNGQHYYTDAYGTGNLFSPNVVPALFAHYQLNFGRSYIYGGPMAGIIAGTNNLNLSNITKPVGGANLGMAITLNKYAKLQIANGWRITHVPLKAQTYTREVTAENSYIERYYDDITLHYFTFTIGVIACL